MESLACQSVLQCSHPLQEELWVFGEETEKGDEHLGRNAQKMASKTCKARNRMVPSLKSLWH